MIVVLGNGEVLFSIYTVGKILYSVTMKTYQSSLPRKKIYLMLAERTNINSETLIDMTYEGCVSENDFKLKLPSKNPQSSWNYSRCDRSVQSK